MHYLRQLTISGFLVVTLACLVSCIDSNQDNHTDPTVDPDLPTPQNLSVKLLDTNCVKISWTYAEEEEEILSFELFRSSNQAGDTLLATMDFNDSALNYVDCNLPVEQGSIQAYSYEVRAIAVNNLRSNLVASFPVIVNFDGEITVYSNTTADTNVVDTIAFYLNPADGDTVSSDSLLLFWDLGVSGYPYNVFLSTNDSSLDTLVSNYEDSLFRLEGLEQGVTYYWKVEYSMGDSLIEGPILSFFTRIKENRPPVFNPAPGDTAVDGDSLSFLVWATDPDGDSLTYTMLDSPEGSVFSNNIFSWTPNDSQSGSYTVRFSVSDNQTPALSDTQEVVVTVLNQTDSIPIFTHLRDTTIFEGQTIGFSLFAVEPDSGTASVSLLLASQGAELEENYFSWKPNSRQSGTHLFRFAVTLHLDSAISDTLDIVITVEDYNQPPVFEAINDTSIAEGETIMLYLEATDPEGGLLRFSMTRFSEGAVLANSIFSWTPTENQAGTHLFRFTVADDGLPSMKDTLDLAVTVTDRPINDTTIVAGQPFSFSFSEVDPTEGMEFQIPNLPENATVTENVLEWTPSNEQVGAHLLNVVLKQSSADSPGDTVSFKIHVVGLIAHWDFNEDDGTTFEDISGNGNHGELDGAIRVNAIDGGGLRFDGDSSAATVQDADLLDVTGGITLSAWVNFGDSLEHYETVLGKRDATAMKESNYAMRTGMKSGVDELEFYWSYPGGWNIYASTNAGLEPNTWYHIAAVYDGTQVKLYKDGVLLTGRCREGSCNTPLLADNNLLRLGKPGGFPDQAGYPPELLSGTLDNVRIYNYALGSADILEIKESEE